MKALSGKVISNKMKQTVVVAVARSVMHPMYQKRIHRVSKYHAHDELGAVIGDTVLFVPTRPISRTKFYKVTKIVKQK